MPDNGTECYGGKSGAWFEIKGDGEKQKPSIDLLNIDCGKLKPIYGRNEPCLNSAKFVKV